MEEDGELGEEGDVWYTLTLTNLEVRRMFRKMVKDWFKGSARIADKMLAAAKNNVILL